MLTPFRLSVCPVRILSKIGERGRERERGRKRREKIKSEELKIASYSLKWLSAEFKETYLRHVNDETRC